MKRYLVDVVVGIFDHCTLILPGLGLVAILIPATLGGGSVSHEDPCGAYATEFRGHVVHTYPESIYEPCGGGIHDGSRMVVRP